MKVKGGSRKEERGDIPGRRNSTGKRYRRGGQHGGWVRNLQVV